MPRTEFSSDRAESTALTPSGGRLVLAVHHTKLEKHGSAALPQSDRATYCPGMSDLSGVVDDAHASLEVRLLVRNGRSPRITDGSATPLPVTVNPNVTATAVGEKCSSLLASDSQPPSEEFG